MGATLGEDVCSVGQRAPAGLSGRRAVSPAAASPLHMLQLDEEPPLEAFMSSRMVQKTSHVQTTCGSGRGSLPFSGRGSLAFSGRGSLPFSGRGSLPFSGRGSLPFSGRGSLAFSGRGSLPFSGHGSLPCSGRGSLPFSGRGSLPCSGRGSLQWAWLPALPNTVLQATNHLLCPLVCVVP
ncbi:unnamed protein product [Boreogadus saida]